MAVFVVVGGVVGAAAVDSLTGRSAPRSPAATTAPPHIVVRVHTAAATGAAGRADGTILFGRRMQSAPVMPGLLIATREEPAPQVVDVGIRPARPAGARIRVTRARLRLGLAVGTPSGERIALWAWNPSRPGVDGIYSRAAQGGTLGRITRAPWGLLQQPLAYSPDGARLLFAQARPGGRGGSLAVVGANGTGRIRLTPPGTTSWCCELGAPGGFGPGGRIAFAAFAPGAPGRAGASAVYVADAGGARPRRITPTLAWATAARWSPDGRWIAFDQADRPGGAHDLFLVHPSGSGLHVIPTAAGGRGSCCPQWAADSRSLVYAAGPPSRDPTLWSVNVDATGVDRLTGDASLP